MKGKEEKREDEWYRTQRVQAYPKKSLIISDSGDKRVLSAVHMVNHYLNLDKKTY